MYIDKENHKIHKSQYKIILEKITAFLKRGTSVHQLALTITLGFFFGIIPLFGVNTFLVTFFALRYKLNLPIILSINFIMFPLQFYCFVLFFKMASIIFKVPFYYHSFKEVSIQFQHNWFSMLSNFGKTNLLAVLIWLILSLALGWFLYKAIFYTVNHIRKGKST